jgi:hypothetical protein
LGFGKVYHARENAQSSPLRCTLTSFCCIIPPFSVGFHPQPAVTMRVLLRHLPCTPRLGRPSQADRLKASCRHGFPTPALHLQAQQ